MPTGRTISLKLGVAAAVLLAACAAPALACEAPPPPVRDIAIPRFYADQAGSKVDPELARLHKEAVAPLTAFVRRVVGDADKAVRRRDAKRAECPLAWIEAWARGEAWLGVMGTKQAEYQRKWDLAGVALAYLKLRPFATAEQRRVIEPWLIRFADVTRAFLEDPARKRNNHWYWLGLALAATALATGSEPHWAAARAIMQDAASHIGPDGTLPLELEREGRALHYHAFATTPLVVMAELAAARGEDWYALGDGALHRLVLITVKGLDDRTVFNQLAGHEQEAPGTGAGWLWLYGKRFPERLPKALPDVPEKHRWLGGDVSLLSETLAGLRSLR